MKTSSSAFAGTAINTWEIFDSQKGIIGKLQQPSKLKIIPMGKRVWIPVSDGTEMTSYKKATISQWILYVKKIILRSKEQKKISWSL